MRPPTATVTEAGSASKSQRDKARRGDALADEDALYDFFDRRLPAEITSGKTFEAWRARAERDDPTVLELAVADILLDDAEELGPEHYPDQLTIGPATLALAYRFDPGADDDGITATVPLGLLPQLDAEVLAWTIPGWHHALIAALLEGLPKAVRKALFPLDALAEALALELAPFVGPMVPTLTRAIFERTGERVARDAWDLRALPPYLTLGFRVVDEHDKVLGAGRDRDRGRQLSLIHI